MHIQRWVKSLNKKTWKIPKNYLNWKSHEVRKVIESMGEWASIARRFADQGITGAMLAYLASKSEELDRLGLTAVGQRIAFKRLFGELGNGCCIRIAPVLIFVFPEKRAGQIRG